MKNLTVNRLALGNLKHRRKQYTIMIIGIILAMVFSSSLVLLMFAAGETYNEDKLRENGKQMATVSVSDFKEENYKDTKGIITKAEFAHIIGYAYTEKDNKKLGSSIAYMNEGARELSYQIFEDGTYPTKDNEIAAEKNALLRLGYREAKVGDTIELTVDVQNGADYLKPVKKEYTLCGILADKKCNIETRYSDASDYDTIVPALFVREGSYFKGGREKVTAYINFDIQKLKEYMESVEHTDAETYLETCIRTELGAEPSQMYVTQNWGYESNRLIGGYDSLVNGGDYYALVILSLVFASCIAIINAFNSNLKERKRQIGMLRAVGATKRQIIKIYGREAFIISLMATPVSVLISYGVVRAAIGLLSDHAVMTKSIWALLISAVINIIVVLFAALIPLLIASKITPMQAIRNINNNRKIKTKKIKSKHSFNAPALLAKRNLMFYKGSKAVVSIMLIVTILFSCIGFSYASYSKEHFHSLPFDYSISSMSYSSFGAPFNYKDDLGGMTESEKNEIKAMDNVATVNGKKELNAAMEVDGFSEYIRANLGDTLTLKYNDYRTEESLKEMLLGDMDDYYYEEQKKLKLSTDYIPMQVNAYDDFSVLEGKEYSGKIDYDKLNSGEEIILIAPKRVQYRSKISGHTISNYYCYDKEIQKRAPGYHTLIDATSDYKAGDKIKLRFPISKKISDEEGALDDMEFIDKTYTIGAIISPAEVREVNTQIGIYGMALLTTVPALNQIYADNGYSQVQINMFGDVTDEMDLDMTENLRKYADKYEAWTESNYRYNQQQEHGIQVMYTVLSALIIIGFVICASIINNALSAKIRESKSVIGTLRAVGADQRDLTKSYVRQMLSMFGTGTLLGYGLFALTMLCIYLYTLFFDGNFSFIINPWITLVMTALTFGVCAMNIYLKIQEEMKNSIVENIREL